MSTGGSNPNGAENRPPRLKQAFQKSMSWLKSRKGDDSKDSAGQGTSSNKQSRENGGHSYVPINNAPTNQPSTASASTKHYREHADRGVYTNQQTPHSPSATGQSSNIMSSGDSEYGNAECMTPTAKNRFPIDEAGDESEAVGAHDFATQVEEYDMDTNARAALRTVLEKKVQEGLSGVSLGRFLVCTYYNRDEGIGGLVTRLTIRQLPYASIALAVLEAVSLLVTDDELYEVNQRSSGNARYYSRPILPPTTVNQSNTMGVSFQRPGPRRVSTTTNTTSSSARRPSNTDRDTRHIPSYGLPPHPPPHWYQPPPPPAPSNINSTSQGYGIAMSPQYQIPLQSQMVFNNASHPNHGQYNMPPYLPNIDVGPAGVNQYNAGPVHIAGSENYPTHDETDEDPPLLRPTTMDRIHRGYYDHNIDSGRL